MIDAVKVAEATEGTPLAKIMLNIPKTGQLLTGSYSSFNARTDRDEFFPVGDAVPLTLFNSSV